MILIGCGGYAAKLHNDGFFTDEGPLDIKPTADGGYQVTRYPPDGMPVTIKGDEWICSHEPACQSHFPETYTVKPFEMLENNGWKCLERAGCNPTLRDLPLHKDPGPEPDGTSI